MMTKLLYDSLSIQHPSQEEQDSQMPSRAVERRKLKRSRSAPAKLSTKTIASHKTLRGLKSEAPTAPSDQYCITTIQPKTVLGKHKIGQIKASEPAHSQTIPAVPRHGYVTFLPEEPHTPICEQPRLSYFSYLGSNRHRVSALRQLMRPNEEEEWEQFPITRLVSTEPQEATAVAIGYSKFNNTDKWIDCCTCMCCVKALFYHCTKDDGHYQVDPASNPCSCQRPGTECAGRWGILGALSIFMPCMWCYPLIQAARACSGSETVKNGFLSQTRASEMFQWQRNF